MGRVRTDRQRRDAILEDFERSGMSGAAYAELHGIKYSTFAHWAQKRRRQRGGEEALRRPGATRKREPMALALAEVLIGQPDPPESAKGLRIELPGGAVLILGDTRQADLAAGLIWQLNLLGQSRQP
jgi:hypothetical protein